MRSSGFGFESFSSRKGGAVLVVVIVLVFLAIAAAIAFLAFPLLFSGKTEGPSSSVSCVSEGISFNLISCSYSGSGPYDAQAKFARNDTSGMSIQNVLVYVSSKNSGLNFKKVNAGSGEQSINVLGIMNEPLELYLVAQITDKLSCSTSVIACVGDSNAQNNLDIPVADAGSDRTVNSSLEVALNGSGSYDPKGNPLTFNWSQISGASVSFNSSLEDPNFVAPNVSSSENLIFQLVVYNGKNFSLPDNVTITVVNASVSQTSSGYENIPPPPALPS